MACGHPCPRETMPFTGPRPRARVGIVMQTGEIVDGRFEIKRFAGQGGMGDVFLACDRLHGGDVALKILRVTTGQEAERFWREVEVLAELRHPGIVRYVGHG